MQAKTKARLAMGAFLAACLVPSAGMLVIPERSAAANQQLVQPPAITKTDGSFNLDLFQEVTDYIADHFALRQELITADAALNAALFHVSAEEDVVLGRDGWLFYAETVDDYLRTNPLTGRQLWASAHTLALVQEYVQDRGARLLFTAAPNKATLYPQYLPYVGTPLEAEGNLDRLIPLMEEEGVPWADLRGALQYPHFATYFPRDSHWNTIGAALAQQALLSALDKEHQPFLEGRDPLTDSDAFTPCGHRGDLYEMVYPTGTEQDGDLQFARPFTFTHVRQPRGPDDQRIETENPAKTGSLLMFRDSFGNSLYPFMAEEYGSALFSRSMPCQLSLLDQTGADTVIFELVERNLDYLATRPPIFPAPERLLTGTPPQGTGTARLALSQQYPLEGYTRLTGTLTGVDENSPVYVRLGEALYEATPAGEDWDGGCPFTLYVPQDACLEDACVLYIQQGELRTLLPANM